MNIGKAIKKIRKSSNTVNQGQFAAKIGITQSYLSQIESGKKLPSLDLLQVISNQSNIPMPAMLWFSLSESDIDIRKIEMFRSLKPIIDDLICIII
jgi:transcriptional regulator with XRE-family HTH domain